VLAINQAPPELVKNVCLKGMALPINIAEIAALNYLTTFTTKASLYSLPLLSG
jgi:hypothetical protein